MSEKQAARDAAIEDDAMDKFLTRPISPVMKFLGSLEPEQLERIIIKDAKAIWNAATAHAKAAVDEFRVTVRKAIISEQYTSSEMDEQTESSAFLMHRYNKGLQRAARVVDEVAAEMLKEN